jgi:hypothetical protein
VEFGGGVPGRWVWRGCIGAGGCDHQEVVTDPGLVRFVPR